MKKLVASILAVTLTFGAVTLPTAKVIENFGGNSVITANAESQTDSGFTEQLGIYTNSKIYKYKDFRYVYNNDGSICVIRYDGKGKNVTIPSRINGVDVKSVGQNFCSSNTNIESITIPNTVVELCDNAFEMYDFEEYDKKTDKWKVVHNKLKTIKIPKSVTEIGFCAFSNTVWLEQQRKKNSFVIVNDILVDGGNCKGKITIPDTVKKIAAGAFWDSNNLTDVVIPDSVESIGRNAFSTAYYVGESRLKNVTFPDKFINIGEYAFSGTPWLKAQQKKNPIVTVNGLLIDGTKCKGDVKIPDNVEYINNCAFYGADDVTSVHIPGSVKAIGVYAFESMTNLKSVTIDEGVEIIGAYSFAYDKNLKSIKIPASVKEIYPYAVGYYFTNDKNVKISGFTIRCTTGTAGARYARKNGFDYILSDGTKYNTITDVKVTGLSAKTYTGKQLKPAIKVYDGKKLLKNGTDYTVKYGTNKIGKGTVTITGKGSYYGTTTKTFTINPRKTTVSAKSTAKGKITATVAKKSEASKYQIQYSTSSKFKGAKTYTMSAKSTKGVISASSGKTYYVRVRTVKTVGGKNYYSGWSAASKVKVK